MSNRGTFAIDRGWFDHPAFADEPYTEREAWVWLIAEAAYKPRHRRVGLCEVELARGQVAASVRFLAQKWQWKRSKVHRFLVLMKKRDMIETASGTGVSVITICNYDKYQLLSTNIETVVETESGTPAGQLRDKPNTVVIQREKNTSRAKSATPLPKDWKPSEADRAYARSKNWDEARIDSQAERFVNYALAKDRRLRDWAAGWRNWVTSQFQEPSHGRRVEADKPTITSVIDRRIAELERLGTGGDESSQDTARLLPFGRG